MADNWYYVQKGSRQGPVEIEVINSLIAQQELKQEDFVWKKGFDNWKKIKEVAEFQASTPQKSLTPEIPQAPTSTMTQKDFSFAQLKPEERVIFIRIGNDRGGQSADYGPFSINQLKELHRENRINGKTFAFFSGMKSWEVLADLPEYQHIFEQLPPVIKEEDRRTDVRKPFIARLFIQNNKELYEGICRDVSIGGMQVLLDHFLGQAGDKISINVHPENSDYHFVASGVVVRILEGRAGFSFRFNGLSDEAKRAIEKYLQEN